MDKLTSWINDWIVFSFRTRERLSSKRGFDIEPLEFQLAFQRKMGKTNERELLYIELPTVDDAVKIFEDYEFTPPPSPLVEMIELEGSVLPEGIPKLIMEETIRRKGEIWRIHANDLDFLPSNPHAHNIESGLKLHLGTGGLYRKKDLVGYITCKDLCSIRDLLKKIKPPKYDCDAKHR